MIPRMENLSMQSSESDKAAQQFDSDIARLLANLEFKDATSTSKLMSEVANLSLRHSESDEARQDSDEFEVCACVEFI